LSAPLLRKNGVSMMMMMMMMMMINILFLLLLLCFYSPLSVLGHFFSFLILYTFGRTPWTGDQHVSRPLPTHRKHKRRINARNTDIHAFSGIRTHDPSVRVRETVHALGRAVTAIIVIIYVYVYVCIWHMYLLLYILV
jgi:hypothetical protein